MSVDNIVTPELIAQLHALRDRVAAVERRITAIEDEHAKRRREVHQRRADGCPSWCVLDHSDDTGEDQRCHYGSAVTVPIYRHLWIDGGKTFKDDDTAVRVGLQQTPDQPHPVVLWEDGGGTSTELTAGEADNLATILRDFARDMRKAFGRTVEERQVEPCWCNQEHAPGDGHHSDVKSVYLTAHRRSPGSDPHELCLMVIQEPHRREHIEVCESHSEWADHLLPPQAERIADALVLLSLAARLHEEASR